MAKKHKISARRQMPEEPLPNVEQRWQKTFDSINDGICLLSLDQKILQCNQAMTTIFGMRREEMIGRYCYEVIHGTDRPVPECPVTRMKQSLMRESMELQVKDRWFDVTVDPLLDDAGELTGILHIVRDITERKKTEEALRESEKRFGSIVEHVNDAFYIHDFKGKILDCNDNACRMVGWPRSELVGASLGKIGTPEEHRRTPSRMKAVIKEGNLVFDGENLRRDGKTIAVNISVSVVSREGNGIVQSFVRDISERKKTEEALRESEEKYRILAEASPEMIYLVDSQGIIRYVNNAAIALFKGGLDTVVGKHLADLYPPAIAERHLKAIRTVIATGNPIFTELLEDFPTGSHWIDARLSPVKDNKGAIIGVLGLSQDITARRQAEATLAESEEKFRAIIEQNSEGIVLLDEQCCVNEWNPAMEKISGIAAADAKGRPIWEILVQVAIPENWTPARVESLKKMYYDAVATGRSPMFDFPVDVVMVRNGEKIYIQQTIFRIKTGKGYRLGSVLRDITERKKMEERMARDEKLESLRIFGGGIAHDFNNLLAGIFGNIDLARMEMPEGNQAINYLNNAFCAFDRAKYLAQQLLTFAKGGVPQKKPLLLPELVRNVCALALSGSNVKGEFRFSEGLWPIEADENQLSQVFSNLIINAVQAMPQGGTVTIAAENQTLEAGHMGKLPAGKFVVITVKDQGVGIPQKIIGKIFDPFFTTKQQGSGLGLATCYSIVSRHGGFIDVVSETGVGAVFTVLLPASEKSVELPQNLKDTQELRGSGRILIMDDERLIRGIARDMLKRAGYEVTVAAEGKEAIAKYREAFDEGKKLDMVILDLTVPGGMGGEQAIRELLKIDPQVKAIVSSGYSEDAVMARFAEYGFAGTVPKPYSLRELLTTVKKVMENKKE